MASARIARHRSGKSRVRIGVEPEPRRDPVPRGDQPRRDHEGHVEQQHEDRHAAHDLDVEARHLPQHEPPRQRATASSSPSAEAIAKATSVTKIVIPMPFDSVASTCR